MHGLGYWLKRHCGRVLAMAERSGIKENDAPAEEYLRILPKKEY